MGLNLRTQMTRKLTYQELDDNFQYLKGLYDNLSNSIPNMKGGTFSIIGDDNDGVDTFMISHGLGTTPSVHIVTRNTDPQISEFQSMVDSTNIIITFLSGPPAPGLHIVLNWFAY